MTAGLATGLADLVPPEALLTGPEREGWAVAGVVPEAVVLPGSVDETAGVLGRASEEGWTVVPAGRGRWLDGGAPPERVDVVLGTRRMDRILHYEAADLTISVEAGMEMDALASRLAEEDQWLPLDPPGAGAGTVGALLATGTAGPLEAGFGRPRDHVLGGVLVTGDGRILRLGGRVVKNVAGFDLVRLAVGSRGALGVLTEATLRLFPRPERDVTLRLPGPDRAALIDAARAVATAPVPLAAVELVEDAPRDRDARPGTGPAATDTTGSGAVLLVRALGGPDAVESTVGTLLETLDVDGAGPPERLEGPDSAALHRRLGEIEDGASLVVRLALLPARLDETLARAGDLADRAAGGGRARTARGGGPSPVVAAHVATGVVRVVVRGPVGADEIDGWAAALARTREDLESSGGSLVLSSGPPALVRAVGPGRETDEVRALLEGLGDAFDPAGIMAPGRLFT